MKKRKWKKKKSGASLQRPAQSAVRSCRPQTRPATQRGKRSREELCEAAVENVGDTGDWVDVGVDVADDVAVVDDYVECGGGCD